MEVDMKEVRKMKIDFNKVLKTLDGLDMKKQEDGTPLTLKDTVVSAILQPLADVPAEEKWARYQEGKKIFNYKEPVEVTEDEKNHLISEVSKRHTVVLTGAAMEAMSE